MLVGVCKKLRNRKNWPKLTEPCPTFLNLKLIVNHNSFEINWLFKYKKSISKIILIKVIDLNLNDNIKSQVNQTLMNQISLSRKRCKVLNVKSR